MDAGTESHNRQRNFRLGRGHVSARDSHRHGATGARDRLDWQVLWAVRAGQLQDHAAFYVELRAPLGIQHAANGSLQRVNELRLFGRTAHQRTRTESAWSALIRGGEWRAAISIESGQE